jgi:hypothetical protein
MQAQTTSPHPSQEFDDAQQSHVGNYPEQVSARASPRVSRQHWTTSHSFRRGNAQAKLMCLLFQTPERKTRSDSRHAWHVISSVFESPIDDDLGLEESLTGPIAAKNRAASSLAKEPARKGQTRTADSLRGHLSIPTSTVGVAGAGHPRIQWDVVEEELPSAVPRSTQGSWYFKPPAWGVRIQLMELPRLEQSVATHAV